MDSFDRSRPYSLNYRNTTLILIGRWLNGMTRPLAVRIYCVPASGNGSLAFIEEHKSQWADWDEAVKATLKRARLLIDTLRRPKGHPDAAAVEGPKN
ncbi:MAG: hypothetical protein QM617_00505 [Comamonas sp.]